MEGQKPCEVTFCGCYRPTDAEGMNCSKYSDIAHNCALYTHLASGRVVLADAPAKQPQGMSVEAGYEPLAEVFQAALDQSQRGKGKERHASDRPILRQPICEIGRMVGVGYNVGQAMKKGQESMRLPADRAQAELLGAINYLAAAYLLIEERKAKHDAPTPDICINYTAIDCGSFCDPQCQSFQRKA